jgi:RNA polymerase sigma-70 factor, ECF subfamily
MTTSDLELDLVLRAQSGDRAARAQLFLLHYDVLERHIARRLSRPLERLVRPEDVLHQTLVRAAQAMGRYEARHAGAFRAWLKTIADNLIKNMEKRQQRERLAEGRGADGEAVGRSGSWKALIERVAGDATSPSTGGQRRENARRVQAALAVLPQQERDIVRRYYLEGESLERIAEQLGCTKAAVRGMCYRARRRLRELMGGSSLYFGG